MDGLDLYLAISFSIVVLLDSSGRIGPATEIVSRFRLWGFHDFKQRVAGAVVICSASDERDSAMVARCQRGY